MKTISTKTITQTEHELVHVAIDHCDNSDKLETSTNYLIKIDWVAQGHPQLVVLSIAELEEIYNFSKELIKNHQVQLSLYTLLDTQSKQFMDTPIADDYGG